MKQYINLYEPEEDSGELVTASFIVEALLVLLFILIIATGTMLWGWWGNRSTYNDAVAQEEKIIATNLKLKRKLHKAISQSKMKEEYEYYNKMYMDMEAISNLLAQVNINPKVRISRVLEGLAKHHTYGISLSTINIGFFAAGINLVGEAINEEAVPAFLKKLENNKVFGEVPYKKAKTTSGLLPSGKTTFVINIGKEIENAKDNSKPDSK